MLGNTSSHGRPALAASPIEAKVQAKVWPLEKARKASKPAGELLERRRAERNVAEFAARAGLFAVKMKMSRRNGQHLSRFRHFPNEIDHRGDPDRGGRAQGQAANSP